LDAAGREARAGGDRAAQHEGHGAAALREARGSHGGRSGAVGGGRRLEPPAGGRRRGGGRRLGGLPLRPHDGKVSSPNARTGGRERGEDGIMKRSHRIGTRLAIACGLAAALGSPARPAPVDPPAADPLEAGFQKPPDSAKPRAWWHWLNGNVTKEGITADLEWMKRVGIAGMQMFDGSLGVPQFTEKRLGWMTPDWEDGVRDAAADADRLRLGTALGAAGGD